MTTPVSSRVTLAGRKALVTGGARGIGRACALALAREGANVAILDLLEPGETVAEIEALGGQALGFKASVSSRPEVERVVSEIAARWGGIDVLVNNAGVCARVGLEDLTDELYERDMDVIMRGTYLCTQLVYPYMKAAGYGKIVTISSVSGKMGGPTSRKGITAQEQVGRSGPAYAAAKGAVMAFTKWVARDGGRYGICANVIAPGPIHTELTRGFDYAVEALPIGRWGEPEDVAEAVVFLASPASNFITGSVIDVDGGMVMD